MLYSSKDLQQKIEEIAEGYLSFIGVPTECQKNLSLSEYLEIRRQALQECEKAASNNQDYRKRENFLQHIPSSEFTMETTTQSVRNTSASFETDSINKEKIKQPEMIDYSTKEKKQKVVKFALHACFWHFLGVFDTKHGFRLLLY